ncbi:DEAD/DEAH box helicase [Areca yellow leaf disease phytoplasma]|uniref:DEAD/DEAH box helicase n=1 Tax=Areca yellow leaf disease phytoplasma TaxID=927614 RepID=UPI0035B52382
MYEYFIRDNYLFLGAKTKKALKELNFIDATPIQALVIPEIIKGHDVIGQAQTGTGKTFCFWYSHYRKN